MSLPEWQRLEQVFQDALDVEPSRRAEVVERGCAGDAELRREVERLLAQAGEAGEFLEAPAMDQMTLGATGGGSLEPVRDSLIGQLAGPYRIEAEIGRGGMGAVYRAVRDDGAYLQEVAVKVVKRGVDVPDLLERFRRERQILAMVNHPHIARILDGGATADGRPYYAMEFVAGEPVTQYCYRNKLDLPARLRLFLDVCAAVAHAHQNLIIHRDLKPANILVNREGAVKLLDFGIAKIFFEDMPDMGQTVAAGAAMLTPNYAAPEQVRNERVTTATDVYALGLILYELLTGRRAQQAGSSSPAALERAVCEEQPMRPSDAVTVDGVTPAASLRGDLETILLKAVQKDPARRYATVNQFAEDLERFLDGRPVAARPDSFRYRAGMFVRRNKLAVGAAALVAASLIGGIGVALWQARIARGHFQAVRSLAKSLINEINPAIMDVPGTTKARHLIVKRSVEYLDQLSAGAGSDPAILTEAAEAYEAVATLQGNRNKSNLGDYAGAMASFRKALAIRDRIESIAPSVENKRWIAMINAEASRVYPNSEEALAMARKAVAVGERVRTDTDKQGVHVYPNTLFGLGYLLTMREESEEAVATFTKAREVYVKVKRVPSSLSVCDRYLGINLRMLGRPAEALEAYRRGLAIDEPIAAQRPTPRYRMDLSYDYEGVAKGLGDQGHWREALSFAQRARDVRTELAKADPNDNRARTGLADADETLGWVQAGLGDRAASFASLGRAIDERERIVKAAPESPEDQYELARTYLTAGLARQLLGICAEAPAWFDKARPILADQGRKLSLAQIERAATACR